jgi:hypothetical protein
VKATTYTLPVNVPSLEDFASSRFKQYGNFAQGEGRYLFDLIMSPESFNTARIATLTFNLPAASGVAESCYQAALRESKANLRNFDKQFIGAVICVLMESNGFEKTGKKKAIPHSAFTKGEMYRLHNNTSTSNS